MNISNALTASMKAVALVAVMVLGGHAVSAQDIDTITVRIKGMRCDECAHKVMTKVMENKGVGDIWFNIERRTASISYDRTKTDEKEVLKPLKGTRYNPTSYAPADIIMRGFGQRMAELRTDADGLRVIKVLQGKVGVDSLALHMNKNYLFIRYDANRISRADIRRYLIDEGFTPSNYYTGAKVAYANYTIPADKAAGVKVDDILALDGVEDACINVARGTLAVTYFNDETTAAKLDEGIRALGIGNE